MLFLEGKGWKIVMRLFLQRLGSCSESPFFLCVCVCLKHFINIFIHSNNSSTSFVLAVFTADSGKQNWCPSMERLVLTTANFQSQGGPQSPGNFGVVSPLRSLCVCASSPQSREEQVLGMKNNCEMWFPPLRDAASWGE